MKIFSFPVVEFIFTKSNASFYFRMELRWVTLYRVQDTSLKNNSNLYFKLYLRDTFL